MHVLVYVEHGCLGPGGSETIGVFCKLFNLRMNAYFRDKGISLVAAPRGRGDPEFHYFMDEEQGVGVIEHAVDQYLGRVGFTRDKIEDKIAAMAFLSGFPLGCHF